MNEKNIILPEKATGFECETVIENTRFHTVLTAEAFLPSPTPQPLSHNHAVFEGHLTLSGSAELITPHGCFSMEKNDFCIIPPRTYHYTVEKKASVSAITFSFSFRKVEKESKTDLYQALTEALNTDGKPLLFTRAFALAHTLFELTEEMGRGALGKSERLQTKTAEALFCLLDLICPSLRGECSDALSPSTRQQFAIDNFFAQNYDHDVTAKDLADIIFLSERQTNRVLEELYGLSFKQKLIEARIQIAMQRLIRTNLSVTEVARLSGYQSNVGFHTAFRQLTGMTPAKYRKMMKQ
ncbi:MAG: helix-turn-helix transcriptional regulator [Clostridia bacterium]|nr:helix-turn-helix transcriptional regulator [Clostridia bacterium]